MSTCVLECLGVYVFPAHTHTNTLTPKHSNTIFLYPTKRKHPAIKTPADGTIFAGNEGYWFEYPEAIRTCLTGLQTTGLQWPIHRGRWSPITPESVQGGYLSIPDNPQMPTEKAAFAVRMLSPGLPSRAGGWHGDGGARSHSKQYAHRFSPAFAPADRLDRDG